VFIGYVNLGGPPVPDPAVGPAVIPFMNYGETSDAIRRLQAFMNRVFPSYSHLPVTGFYGEMTTAVIKEFQRRVGIVGGDGRNVGVQTRAKLYEHGFRG
jgi:peptidoglycan hydrolase-like protein with peptidoglycan-binding domain